MSGDETKTEILGELWKIPHFDVHSHFGEKAGPVESVNAYIGSWTQPEIPPRDEDAAKWARGRWRMKRSSWFSRAALHSLRGLYESDDEGEIARRMNDVRSIGLLESIEWIRERSNVETIVVDSNPQLPLLDDHILSTYRLDPRALTWRGCDLEERIREIEADVEALRTKGAVSCFKVPNAYSRTLRIDKPSPSQARKAAVKEGPKRSSKEQKGVEDYLFRHFFERAAHWGMPVEIHTGFGWAIGERPLRLSEADPENLLPILEDPLYQPTTFILFHGGYPFTSKMGYIAGSFPNVYLDFTCLCPESWRMLKRSLHEWIDIVPMDRIVTGSDGSYEWLYFGAKLNRECLAEVLAEKVQDEYMGLDLALEVGRRVLYANANSVLHYG